MNALLAGLMYGQPAALWAGGIGVAIAWLTRSVSAVRLAVLAAAILWPAAPIAIALSAQHEAESASREFNRLCETQARERFIRHPEPVSSIFVDGTSGPRVDAVFRYFGSEIGTRLTLEQPGYREVQLLERNPADGKPVLNVRRRGQSPYAVPSAQRSSSDEIARFGVRFTFEGGQPTDLLREFRVAIVDREKNEVLAEQKSFLYRSQSIAVGGYPLWRQQERTCPLSHPSDFTRAALPPQAM